MEEERYYRWGGLHRVAGHAHAGFRTRSTGKIRVASMQRNREARRMGRVRCFSPPSKETALSPVESD